jgi:hypothetical protein
MATDAAGLEPKGETEHPTSKLRSTAVVALLVFATVAAMLTPVAIWGRNLVLNTDRYVQTMAPLATNPAIQADIVRLVDEQFTENIDVSALAKQVLPTRAGDLLAGPLEAAASGLVNTVVQKFVESPAFAKLWNEINRIAHVAVVAILTGSHNANLAISIKNDIVSLNLGPIIDQIKTQLVNAGLTVAANVPIVGATLRIADVHGIDQVRSWVRWLNRLAYLLPFLSLVLFAGAVLLSRRRRHTLIASGLCVAGAMVAVGISTNVGHVVYVNNLRGQVSGLHVSGYVYDQLVRFLREGIRILGVVALLFSLTLWLTGPSARAGRFRAAVSGKAGDATRWSQNSPAVATLAANRGIVSGVIVGIAALVLLLWNNPSSGVVFTVIVLAGALIVVVLTYRVKGDGAAVAPDPDLPSVSHA